MHKFSGTPMKGIFGSKELVLAFRAVPVLALRVVKGGSGACVQGGTGACVKGCTGACVHGGTCACVKVSVWGSVPCESDLRRSASGGVCLSNLTFEGQRLRIFVF